MEVNAILNVKSKTQNSNEHKNSQKLYEEVLNISNQQGQANHNHNKISYQAFQNGY